MAINLQNYLDRISSLGIIQLPKQSDVSQNLNTETTISEKDAYIPSMSNAADIMPSTNYNANGMQVGEMPMAPVSSSESSYSDFMETLSQAFRANVDSIQMTMDSLGLTIDDLSDETNMTTLASAMNDGAIALGVPTVENMSDVVANLVQKARGVSEISSTETPAVEENQAASTESGGANSSNSEDETTEKIVVINGITYLETTKVENGVEITTRQEL
ncbi:MAG: hypothetical protein E7273_13595 [Pseudobutyrivibrio ruminis]|nr:hypothetical protein [Pseudobutyrivibrio ruminis]